MLSQNGDVIKIEQNSSVFVLKRISVDGASVSSFRSILPGNY